MDGGPVRRGHLPAQRAPSPFLFPFARSLSLSLSLSLLPPPFSPRLLPLAGEKKLQWWGQFHGALQDTAPRRLKPFPDERTAIQHSRVMPLKPGDPRE